MGTIHIRRSGHDTHILKNAGKDEYEKAVKAWRIGEVIHIEYGCNPAHHWFTSNLDDVTGIDYEDN